MTKDPEDWCKCGARAGEHGKTHDGHYIGSCPRTGCLVYRWAPRSPAGGEKKRKRQRKRRPDSE